ncbi:MAG: hypothetical protein V1755_10505 [Chloroflexota bacterium]
MIEWSAPALIFAVCVYCFGILLSRLGYFQDDWHHVFYAYWQGSEGLQRFLLVDRGPLAWTVYAAFFKILGFTPAAWHWSLMLVRFLTVQAFWLSVRRIWPQAGGLTGWFALLFAAYPIFTLQPLAVAYALHWTMYLVFMLSILSMLEAVRHPRSFAPLTVVALVLQATHLAVIEYFAGLELARPVILWLLLRGLPPRERMKHAVKRALPYLVVLLLYSGYRSSYGAIFGYDRFGTLATLAELLRSPLAGLQGILQAAVQDLVYVVFSQWYAAVDPAIIDLSRPSTYYILGSIVGFAVLAYFVMTRVDRLRNAADESPPALQIPAAGILIVILSMLPFWVAGFSIYQKNQLWSERLALAAMPGASMLVVGAVYALVDRGAYRHLVLSILLGLGVGLHVQTARSFQASWDKQRQFYWQLHWRAPALQPNTLVVADQEILFFMGIYPTAFAVNVLYPQVTPPLKASYWFNAGFEHMDFDKFAAGEPDAFEKYGTRFTTTVQDVLAITFEPGSDQCLWVLRPELANARSLTAPAKTWLGVSNPSRIKDSPENVPPSAIFGEEPPRPWCYYYEKADLARQYREWNEVVSLWRAAGDQGLRAPNAIEMLPFIEAFGRQGSWQEARSLTRQAQVLPDRSASVLCDLWRDLASTALPSVERDQAAAQAQEELGCQL